MKKKIDLYLRKCIMVDEIQLGGILHKTQTPVQIDDPHEDVLLQNLRQF